MLENEITIHFWQSCKAIERIYGERERIKNFDGIENEKEKEKS